MQWSPTKELAELTEEVDLALQRLIDLSVVQTPSPLALAIHNKASWSLLADLADKEEKFSPIAAVLRTADQAKAKLQELI